MVRPTIVLLVALLASLSRGGQGVPDNGLVRADPPTARSLPPGFTVSPFFGERTATFRVEGGIRVHLNAPAAAGWKRGRPVELVLYALPNGNTIEQTVGRRREKGLDWHWSIQHIGAQTRWVRRRPGGDNRVVAYLEAEGLSWPAWRRRHADAGARVVRLVRRLRALFPDPSTRVVLSGHSGGGRFVFTWLEAVGTIPDAVRRITFLDSNYGYTRAHGDKLIRWLRGGGNRCLCVLAYDDARALYKGKPVVSATGGTGYRTGLMVENLGAAFSLERTEDDRFRCHRGLGGRIDIRLKKNPERRILHTVQVERNGFIHALLAGTPLDEKGYAFYGPPVYRSLVQAGECDPLGLLIPPRPPGAPGGATFMRSIANLPFAAREAAIRRELVRGNVPAFLRRAVNLTLTHRDARGKRHKVEYRVLPDYLAVGRDSDFCRVPMGPRTAQAVADLYGACLPTAALVDQVYRNCRVKLAPVPYRPVGNRNGTVAQFVRHNRSIEKQRRLARAPLGALLGGIKKDLVLSRLIHHARRPNRVVIYGWHRLDGRPIQPLSAVHVDTYVDYSHGVRLLGARLRVDGTVRRMEEVLRDPVLFRLICREKQAIERPRYPGSKR